MMNGNIDNVFAARAAHGQGIHGPAGIRTVAGGDGVAATITRAVILGAHGFLAGD